MELPAGQGMRMDARAAGLAVLLTIGLFMLLPYVHMVVPAPPPVAHLTTIPVVALPPAPPPLPPPEITPSVPPVVTVSQPELPVPVVQAVPLTPVLDFNFALGGVGGDFDLAFSVAADAGTMAGSGIFELADVDTVPQAIVQMRPFYPAHARRRRIEGDVTVLFTVDARGRTGNVRIVASTPGDVFAEAATRAVGRWRFTPAMKDGEPVVVRVRQVIRFRMEE